MNRKKWQNPEIPLSALALKLCEEAAEVGGEITDGMMNPGSIDIDALADELDHVDFISSLLRARVQEMRAAEHKRILAAHSKRMKA